LSTHFSGNNKFVLYDDEYIIDSVTEYSKYSAEQREWQKHNSPGTKELYIYKQKGIYDNPNGEYELVGATMYFPKIMEAITVAVYYKKSESKYFMNEESFVPLIKANGWPNVNLHFTDNSHAGTSWTSRLNEQSKLRLLGYTVQQADGMSAGERQSLLRSIIDSGLMTDVEIVNHLEWLVHINEGNPAFANACSCWKHDMEFVKANSGKMWKNVDFNGVGTNAANGGNRNRTSTANRPRYSAADDSTTTEYSRFSKRNVLINRRTELNRDLQSATGLFNVFKRMRIRREISEIDNQLARQR